MTRVRFFKLGANRPRGSLPNPCRRTLARHCDQTTSETLAESKPLESPLLDAAGLPLPCCPSVSATDSGSSLSATRESSLKNARIFFCPTPGVEVSSENGVPNRSPSVRPRKTKGRRRSLGKAQ